MRYILSHLRFSYLKLLLHNKVLIYYTNRLIKNKRFRKQLEYEEEIVKSNNNQKKVLLCVHSLDWGGAERFAVDTIKFLQEKKINYCVFVEKSIGNVPKFERLIGVSRIVYAQYYQDSPSQILQLVQYYQPTILHIHHSYSAYKALSGIPRNVYIVDTLHIMEYQTGGYPYLSAKNTRYINMHHVISRGLKNYLQYELGVPSYKLRLGYLTNRSLSLEKKVRKLNPMCLTLGFLGRFEKQKRPELFIYLTSFLNKKINIPIKCIMQGEGSLKSDCEFLIQKLNLKNIEILDADNNIDEFHEKIDIIVNPAENEGLALIALESAKKGTVFISTNVGQQNEIVSQTCLVSIEPLNFMVNVYEIIHNMLTQPEIVEMILNEQESKWKKIASVSEREMILELLYG